MSKRILALILSGIFLSFAFNSQPVSAQSAAEDQMAARARADVLKLSVEKNARVEVKLRDNRRLKGYISDTAPDSFILADSKSGTSQTVPYADVAQVKKSGGGLSTRTWVTLAAVAAGSIITWIVIKPALCDGGAQSRGPC